MTLFSDLAYLFFPRLCAGCGEGLSNTEQVLCFSCDQRLPATGFHLLKDNPVDQIFRGRTGIELAASCFYFSKDSLMQRLVHQFKYKGRTEIISFLGKRMGMILKESDLFPGIDAIVPVPLFPLKEKKRGYNQAALLAEEIARILSLPVLKNVLVRYRPGATQTRKARMERWQNVEEAFALKDPQSVAGKSLLLVDDVLTTGATLEACALALQQAPEIKIFIITLAFAND